MLTSILVVQIEGNLTPRVAVIVGLLWVITFVKYECQELTLFCDSCKIEKRIIANILSLIWWNRNSLYLGHYISNVLMNSSFISPFVVIDYECLEEYGLVTSFSSRCMPCGCLALSWTPFLIDSRKEIHKYAFMDTIFSSCVSYIPINVVVKTQTLRGQTLAHDK